MANVFLVLVIMAAAGGTAAYDFAPSKGCMILYKNQHAHGASWVKKDNGQWSTWTSAECRDWCAAKAACKAVDFVGQDKSCLEHKGKVDRIPATSASTGKSQPETVSQYAKECGSQAGYGGVQKSVLFLDLIITLDASSATGSSAYRQTQQFIIMMLQTYQLGGNSLRLKIVFSSGTSIQVFTFDNDSQTQSYISQIQRCSYSGATINIELIFQRIQSFYLSFQRAGAGRSLIMMGGFNVGSSWEIKTRVALYVQMISTNFRLYYFATGSQTNLYFWRDILDQSYIVQSFSASSSWVVNWFQRSRSSFTRYGLWVNMKRVNLQLVLTLDSSSATGRDGYYRTFYMILTLLRTHTVGSGNLQLYVCVHRGSSVSVVQFRSASDVGRSLNTLSTSISYAQVSVNVVMILQKVQWVMENYISTSQPRTVWLCGGMQVTNQQQVNLILYKLEVTLKVYIYYYAMGVQTDTSYWRQALGSTYVRTDFSVTSSSVDSILIRVIQAVSNLSGPTVTQVISSAGGSSGGSQTGGSETGSNYETGNRGNGGNSETGNRGNGGNSETGNRGNSGNYETGNRGNGGNYGTGNRGNSGNYGTGNRGNSGNYETGNRGNSGNYETGNRGNSGNYETGNRGNGGYGGGTGSGINVGGDGGIEAGRTQTVNVQIGRNTLTINGRQVTVQFFLSGGKLYVSQNINPAGKCPSGTRAVSSKGWCQVTSIDSFKTWTLTLHLNINFSSDMMAVFTGGVGSQTGGGGRQVSGGDRGSESNQNTNGGTGSGYGGGQTGGSGTGGSSQTVTNVQNGRNTIVINGRTITVQFMVSGGRLYVSQNINPAGSCPSGTMASTSRGWCQVTSIENFKAWTSSMNLNIHFSSSIMAIFSGAGSQNVGGGRGQVSGGGGSVSTQTLSMRIVNGVTQVPAAMNVQGGCMSGTSDVGEGYCAINDLNTFIAWAQSAGFNVEKTTQNGVQTVRITGSFSRSYSG